MKFMIFTVIERVCKKVYIHRKKLFSIYLVPEKHSFFSSCLVFPTAILNLVTWCVTFSSLFISDSMFEMVILCMMMSVTRLSSDCHLALAVLLR